jgi:hypothetical protein
MKVLLVMKMCLAISLLSVIAACDVAATSNDAPQTTDKWSITQTAHPAECTAIPVFDGLTYEGCVINLAGRTSFSPWTGVTLPGCFSFCGPSVVELLRPRSGSY